MGVLRSYLYVSRPCLKHHIHVLKQQGRFRHEHPKPNLVIGATKLCVFEKGENVTPLEVLRSVQNRMKRMRTS